MADVAERAGVSRTLVSLIFSDKPGASDDTRGRVLRAADELAYQPDRAAQLLARGRSRTLGVLTDVKQTFQAEMIGTVYDAAEAAGYEVLLSASGPTRDERKAIEALLSHRCEGLILFNPLSESDYLRSVALRAALTIVGRGVPDATANTVRSADATGIAQSVEHLVALGHRDIVHIDGGEHAVSTERRLAYVAAMRRHRLDAFVRVFPGAHDEAAGMAAASVLLGEDVLPTAVMAGNDRCALGVMDGFTKAGVSIPDDVSIVGYDDSPLSSLTRIDLTTVRQDSAELARRALAFTVSMLDTADAEPGECVIEPELVIRGTTAAARPTSPEAGAPR
ncbi:LacI family DNA-binding transcriptional regulator [Rhodococcoides yunnanense]|uniref:LacI family DNA-binding transcriptional regulator n=1 Tax=Rhodococcoides yunnanense TaxID=278209 RepID=UPI000935447F|nr:LacI family DNA-binding transcriptional regulator [Rhodococcus yunnanensis]